MPQAKHCLVVVLWQKSGSYCLHAELLWMLPLLRLMLQLLVAAGDSLSVAQCCTEHTVCCRLGWPSRSGLSHLSFEGHWSRCAGMGAKQFAFIQKCILWKRGFCTARFLALCRLCTNCSIALCFPLDPCTSGSSCAWQRALVCWMQSRGELCSVNGGTALSSILEAAPSTSEAVWSAVLSEGIDLGIQAEACV